MKIRNFKILSLLLVCLFAFGLLVGCGQSTPPAEDPAPVESQEPAEQPSDAVDLTEAVNAYFADMPSDIYKIPEKDLVEKVIAGEDMFILDIRQPDVYNEGHLKGAVNVPYGPNFADCLDLLPADKPIMIYCYTGQTAGQTVMLLNLAGFTARSTNLGWNLGLAKVEGVEAVTEITPNDFGDVTTLDMDPGIQEAIVAYFQGLADVKDTPYANYKVSEDDAKKLLDEKDPGVVFVSIRSAEDFAKGHIEGALNVPFGKGMEQQFNTLPKDKKLIVYCYTGQTAGQTVAGLKLLGFDAVSLNSGMGTPATGETGWSNKGFSVVE